ncbi:hypothetical protein SARC_04285 [Sphaeroforma arctica JP610]|uniref:TNFR-Cys domain-containing protein n=1 Tax=Sphaeroforma arctica JP610 TaxID=667725 RepID=A0A0L0G3R2_9EUKA|nr:hypothetical protein SARC_04285 [Sphaeroforma arctica JP610]KNC83476.1 hypothetical protein SARC_04285 [Sphaeroforma arctica JP610]|eukprot:XP_014157378.1 hypothetical protein SARC_04285 [Sphaeroforma arctica JP610]
MSFRRAIELTLQTLHEQGECTSKQDVQCDCPTGKTGPNCEDDCKLPANCLEGDASTCQFDALDLSFGAVCTACNEGFYLQDSICIPCTTCPGNALPIEACTVTEDAVCACDAGKSGSACNINCEVPVGCSGLNLSTTVCQYSLDSGTKGIECTGCSSGFYHRQDNKQCAQITECNFNNEFEITSFNETADRVCQSVQTCHAGLDGTGTYTYSMFTKTKDTVCRSCTQSSSCVDGKLVSECTDDFDIICESCAEDYSGNACGYVNVAFQTQMSAQGVLNQTEILLNSWSSGSDIEIHVAENRRRAEDGVVTLNFTRSSADVLEYAMQSTNNRASLAATTESTALRIANEEPVDLDTKYVP